MQLGDQINIIHCPISEVGTFLKSDRARQIFLVCDRNVRWVADRIGAEAAAVFEIDATEGDKDISTVIRIDRWLMEQGADREALLLGIGGGITTDMAGFAASIYKRGIRFAFVPTTLLSQVDASIGGKNGVNLDSYKNMIGVIRQPEAVFICPESLDTLPYTQIVSGASELLKTFIIDNSGGDYEEAVSILSGIRKAGGEMGDYSGKLGELISAAARIKAGIAGRDPFERGERRLLNLGHTFAHAIEKESLERVCHGNAVSMGTILAARLAERLGVAENGFAERLKADFEACGMPTACPFGIDSLTGAMRKDKKAEGDVVHFVIPRRVGNVETMDLSPEYVTSLLRK